MTATISGDGTSTLINLTTSGNTILGDASTDTLNVGNGGLVKDASGNVGIGTASPTAKLHVANAGVSAQATFVGTTLSPYITVVGNSGTTILGNESNGGWAGTTGSQAFVLKTTDTERMRIDSSGNLLVGTTTTPVAGYNCFSEAGADVQLILQRTGGFDGYGGIGAQAAYALVVYEGSAGTLTQRFYVTQAGATYNTTGTYGTISDIKIKENIQDSRGYLEDLCRVRIVKYSLKADAKSAPDKLGVIAQELEQIFPNMIEEQPDVVNGKEVLDTTTKTVKYSVFVPMLIKAMQELKALVDGQAVLIATQASTITALQADVEALKAQGTP